MEVDRQISEWDDWWQEQFKEFLSDTFPTRETDMTSQPVIPEGQNYESWTSNEDIQDTFLTQETDMTSQQAVFPVIPEGQSYESWTSNEDIKSIGSRLDKIEAALHENNDGLRALEHSVGGVAEAVEKLKKNLSAFQKCLYSLLIGGPANEGDKSVVVELT